MYRYLKRFTDNVYYVYHQRSEGHGISRQLDHIDPKTNLLIIVDSSSSEENECKVLHDKGIDVVILDHHEFENKNDYATIVNPQQHDCEYPNKIISGMGVTYKTLQVLDDLLDVKYADDYLGEVMIGMLADQMDMSVMENRALVDLGLRNMKSVCLQAFVKNKNLDIDNLSTIDINFNIIPVINSAARLDKIELALQLFVSDDFDECKSLLRKMNGLNTKRKKIIAELFESYKESIDDSDSVVIATDKTASSGFNGSVAQRLTGEYTRSAIVMKETEDHYRGSFRGYENFDMRTVLNNSGLVEYAAGHAMAGGVGIKKENLDELKKYLNEALKDVIYERYYDLELNASDVTFELAEEIKKFNRITGNGFPAAKFLVKDLFVVDREVIGQTQETVKIDCGDVGLIKFKVDEEYASDVGSFDTVNAIGQIQINEFFHYYNGLVRDLQVMLDGYEVV